MIKTLICKLFHRTLWRVIYLDITRAKKGTFKIIRWVCDNCFREWEQKS